MNTNDGPRTIPKLGEEVLVKGRISSIRDDRVGFYGAKVVVEVTMPHGPWSSEPQYAHYGYTTPSELPLRIDRECAKSNLGRAYEGGTAPPSDDVLTQMEEIYTALSDHTFQWSHRDTEDGRRLLSSLRDGIAEMTGRTPQDVQDDYGTRAARAREAKHESAQPTL